MRRAGLSASAELLIFSREHRWIFNKLLRNRWTFLSSQWACNPKRLNSAIILSVQRCVCVSTCENVPARGPTWHSVGWTAAAAARPAWSAVDAAELFSEYEYTGHWVQPGLTSSPTATPRTYNDTPALISFKNLKLNYSHIRQQGS